MRTAPMDNRVSSFTLAFAVAVLVTAGLFAIKAANPELEEWAEETFGHAWFYQAVLALIVFFGIGFAMRNLRLGTAGAIWTVILSTVVSGLIILGAAGYAALQNEEGREEAVACSATEFLATLDKPVDLPSGETVAVEFLPEKPGAYELACQMRMFGGKFVVE